MWRGEFGVNKDAPLRYGLQWGRAFVWEAQTDEQLQEDVLDVITIMIFN